MIESARYLRPRDLPEALAMSAKFTPRLIAGGTDLYPALAERTVTGDVLDLSAVATLRDILKIKRAGVTFMRIGAMVTWHDVLHHPELAGEAFHALRQCAREVGGQQIQNRGTVVGNVCNASPAADGVPVLMALGASLEIRSLKAQRWTSLESFVLGPRKISLEAGEIVTAIEVPLTALITQSLFLKMGSRRYLVISIVMLAAQWQPGQVCRIAIGACSPVARRLASLEAWYLEGMQPAKRVEAINASLSLLRPIDDVRADQDYRHDLARELCEKLIVEMSSEPHHG